MIVILIPIINKYANSTPTYKQDENGSRINKLKKCLTYKVELYKPRVKFEDKNIISKIKIITCFRYSV